MLFGKRAVEENYTAETSLVHNSKEQIGVLGIGSYIILYG